MTGFDTPPPCGLSSDSLHRITQYQTAGVNARLKLFPLLAAQGVPDSEADDLVAALEAGAVAGAHTELVDIAWAKDWDAQGIGNALVELADRDWSRRAGRAAATTAAAAELTVHLAEVRQRERANLERLEAFVRGSVLPNADPDGPRRRQALEALGEDEGLCTARTHDGDTGDVVICFRPAGHYDPDDEPSFTDRDPGGWHRCGGRTWRDNPA